MKTTQLQLIAARDAGHTEGPWTANANTVWRGGEPIVCHPLNSAASVADARLVAAAPELLAALRGMMREFGGVNGALDPEISADIPRIAALAAIAKAEGRSL